MKILILLWECCGIAEMKDALEQAGHTVAVLKTSQEGLLGPHITDQVIECMKRSGADAVFGFNYFPNVAEAAHKGGFDYYAWVYDNPCVQLYSYTVTYPTNHIYVFDTDTYMKFHSGRIDSIHYLPMAADPDRIEKLCSDNPSGYGSDISFVGSFYTERHNFYTRMIDKGISPYYEGYLRGIMEAQKRLYGMSIVETLLTDDCIKDMYQALPMEPASDSAITQRDLFAQLVIDRRITTEERQRIISLIGSNYGDDYKVALYTHDRSISYKGVNNYGPVDQFNQTPLVFNRSRINLNISLRSIVNGAPLRCFEIMGAGGFLLSSYAGDLTDMFVTGEDYVYYESEEDMLAKITYYLEHEDERAQIAANGLGKIRQSHTYLHRVQEMFG